MPTGVEIRDKVFQLVTTHHLLYRQYEPRDQPDVTGHCDCSGLMCWGMHAVGEPYPESNSADMARQGHALGLGRTIAQALWEPGDWLIEGPREGQDGYGNAGHIGMSLGDGVHSLEARGTYAGVGVFVAAQIGWSYAIRAPGIDYEAKPPPPPKPPPPKPDPLEDIMIVLPPTNQTDAGVVPSARVDWDDNRIALEGGARVRNDHPLPDPNNPGHYIHGVHYWKPPVVAGANVVALGDCRIGKNATNKIAVRYAAKERSWSYVTDILDGTV